MNYWEECIDEAFAQTGIKATPSQMKEVAEAIEGCHENYGTATGDELIPHPLAEANEKLKEELSIEKAMIGCYECRGKGSITENFGHARSSTGPCMACNGAGKR